MVCGDAQAAQPSSALGGPTIVRVAMVARDGTPAPVVPIATPTPIPAPVLTEEERFDATLSDAGWPPELWPQARAVAWCESRWDPSAANPSGSYGLFQLTPLWFSWAGEPFEQWRDPTVNARVAWMVYSEYDGGSFRQWVCQP